MDEKGLPIIKRETPLRNTVFLYLNHGCRLLVPLLVTPLLARRLSADMFGTVFYAQSLMTTVQAFVDFGFNTSSVAEISRAGEDRKKIENILNGTVAAKFRLMLVAAVFLGFYMVFQKTSSARAVYLMLSAGTVFLSIFLPDFLFAGIEKMNVNAFVFGMMKVGSGIGILLFVRGDRTAFLIPVFDSVFSGLAIFIYLKCMGKLGIRLSLEKTWRPYIRSSVLYFASDFLPALNTTLVTVVLGACLGGDDFACWGLAYQMYSAVRGFFSPLRTALFPHIVQKGKTALKTVALVTVPIAAVGCLFCYLCADFVVAVLGGARYMAAADIFRRLLPALFISFPSMLVGWLALGAADRKRELFFSTLIGTLVQATGLVLVSLSDCFFAGDGRVFGIYRFAPALIFIAEFFTLIVRLYEFRSKGRCETNHGN